jgi:hypothetical protein
MTGIRERCPCDASIRIDHPDPAPIAADWRATHPCDRRNGSDRDVTGGGQVEVAYTEPHPTDSKLATPADGPSPYRNQQPAPGFRGAA